MRWKNSTIESDVTTSITNKLDVVLFKTNPDIGVKAGLLGLAPNGKFFNYVQQFTDWGSNTDKVIFGLSLTPNSGAKSLTDFANKSNWSQNQFVIHGKRNGGSIPVYIPLVANSNSWTILANFTLDDPTEAKFDTFVDKRLCVASNYPGMIGFKDAATADLVQTYYNKVCPNSDPAICESSKATKSNVKNAKIGLNGMDDKSNKKYYTLELKTSDFLLFNDQKMTSLIAGKIVDPSIYGCNADDDFVVGRAFLSRYEAVMQVGRTADSMKLGFVANEGTSSIFLIILIILGCIILAICIAIILLKVCKRKSEDNEVYEKQN